MIPNLTRLNTDPQTNEAAGFSKPPKTYTQVARSSRASGVQSPDPTTREYTLSPSKVRFGRTGFVAHSADLPPPTLHLKRSGLGLWGSV